MQALTFDSKIDTWVMIFVVVISVLVAGGLYFSTSSESDTLIGGLISVPTMVCFLWYPMINTKYILNASSLVIKNGFLKWNIKVNTIERVEKTKDFDSSPALSLDRIRITYSHNGQRKSVMISPKDQDQFLSILSSYRQVI